MSNLQVVFFPDSRLKKKSVDVKEEEFGEELQKHMENRRVIYSVVTKSLEVIASLHLTVAPVAEVMLLDNTCGKVFDVAKDVAKHFQSPLSLCRLSSTFRAAVIEILNQLFKIVLVILP